jgi:hypothetical protein
VQDGRGKTAAEVANLPPIQVEHPAVGEDVRDVQGLAISTDTQLFLYVREPNTIRSVLTLGFTWVTI